MRLATTLMAAAAISLFTGCGTPGAPQPPSLQLPQIPQDLTAARKGQRVILTWTTPRNTTDGQLLRHPASTRLCRSPAYSTPTLQIMEDCGSPADQLPPGAVLDSNTSGKPQSRYVDSPPQDIFQSSTAQWATYAIESTNARGRSAGLSNQVQVSLAPTLMAPQNVRASVTGEGIIISWPGGAAPPQSAAYQFRYRVERRVKPGSPPAAAPPSRDQPRGQRAARSPEIFLIVGELPLQPQSEYLLADKSFAWEQEYEYKVSTVTSVVERDRTIAEIEGDDSTVLDVFAHDIFPPAIPAEVAAVFSGISDPQKRFIDLSWVPNSEPDLAGYNVYRRQGAAPQEKINRELVRTPAFRDAGVQAGTTYFYAVSAVDVRNNESARSAETSEPVPQ